MQDIYSPPSVSDGEAKKESAREDGEIPTTATTTSLLEAKIVTTSTAVEILPPDSGFEAFWAAYPNKVGKAGARRKFHEILTKGQATASEMIEGAKYYREYQAVKDPNRQYTKHPETWLNKGCWPDRPPIPDGPHAHSNRRLTTAEQVQVGLMNNLRRRGLA